jgi:hypothetical protein
MYRARRSKLRGPRQTFHNSSTPDANAESCNQIDVEGCLSLSATALATTGKPVYLSTKPFPSGVEVDISTQLWVLGKECLR